MVPYLRAANVKDGSLDLTDVKSMDFSPAEQAVYALRPGDVLVTEGAGSLAAVGASAVYSGEIDGVVCFQNTLLRLRPRGSTDARFLMWWARHAYGSGLLASVAAGANIYHLGADNVRALPASMPGRTEQRAIADYLDAETARVDALARAVRRRTELLLEQFDALAVAIIGDERWRREPLKWLVQYREGPGVLSQDIRDAGVPLLRIVNLVDDTVVMDNLRYLDPAMVLARWPHMRVRAGELIVSGSATSGLPVVVPEEAEGSVPWTGLIRMWPTTPRLDREYLRMFLGSTVFLDQVNLLRTGIGLQHWGPSHLAQVQVPVPPIEEQRKVAEWLSDARMATRETRVLCEGELRLLADRRQALITAAVTGQLDIPAVAA